MERPHPALRNTKQRRRPARQQAPPAATAPLAARPTTHPTCPQSSTARVSGRSTAAERHAGSRTVHFDVPDLELRGDRGTPFEGLVHRVHSNVKLSLFLLAALRAIAWRNSPALALAGAELGVSACVPSGCSTCPCSVCGRSQRPPSCTRSSRLPGRRARRTQGSNLHGAIGQRQLCLRGNGRSVRAPGSVQI